jgi:hypothetical protein
MNMKLKFIIYLYKEPDDKYPAIVVLNTTVQRTTTFPHYRPRPHANITIQHMRMRKNMGFENLIYLQATAVREHDLPTPTHQIIINLI